MSEDVEEGRKRRGAGRRGGGVGGSKEVDTVVVSDALAAPQYSLKHVLSTRRLMYEPVCFRVRTEGGTNPSGWV